MIAGYPGVVTGFTFAQYKAEIDAGRPVLIHVEGHTMVGLGYDDTGSTVYLHDTWDYATHSMTWGGTYSGMQQWGVTVTTVQYIVSGTITASGSPLAGVTLGGLPGNPVTDASGNYSALVAPGWSGTVTPSLAGYVFSPGSRTYTNVAASQTAQNYAATRVYTVTFVEGANGTITGTKVQTVSHGANASAVTAVPAANYHFVNWTGSGFTTSTANPLTVTMSPPT